MKIIYRNQNKLLRKLGYRQALKKAAAMFMRLTLGSMKHYFEGFAKLYLWSLYFLLLSLISAR
jgi:hypothetical protein